jgi:hypothetical protein
MKTTRYVLVLEPLDDDVPVAVRVRHVLKRELRDYRLRCVSIELAASAPPETAANPPRPPDPSAAS